MLVLVISDNHNRLNGLTRVTSPNSVVTYERVLKAHLNEVLQAGIVTVRNGGNPNGNKIANIPIGERVVFIDHFMMLLRQKLHTALELFMRKVFVQNINVYAYIRRR